MGHTWRVRGDVNRVFALVADPRTFPQWLRAVKHVETIDSQGRRARAARLAVGESCRMWVRSLLPYSLSWQITLAAIVPGRSIDTDCQVTLGGRFCLRGRVSYRFEQVGDDVVVTNEQELLPQWRIPRWLAPLAKFAFRLNHRWAMSRARRKLEQLATPCLDDANVAMFVNACFV